MCEACAYNAPCERVLALRVGCPHACAVASLLESADWPQRRRRRNPPCPPLTAIQLVEPHAAISWVLLLRRAALISGARVLGLVAT